MHSFVSGCCSLNIKRALKQFGTPNKAPGKKEKKKKEDSAKTKENVFKKTTKKKGGKGRLSASVMAKLKSEV